MSDTETDDLRALLRAVERALRNPKVHRNEIANGIEMVLESELFVGHVTETLQRYTAGRGGTRPPTKAAGR